VVRDILEKKKHVFGPWRALAASTCSQPGQQERSCTACGLLEQETLALAAHSFGAWQYHPRPDCEQPGTRERACTACPAREVSVLPPRSHAYDKWEVQAASTCLIAGSRVRPCRHCQQVQSEALPLKAHSAGPWQTVVPAALHKVGEQQQACKACGTVLQVRPYYPGDAAFAVNFCVMGPKFSDVNPDICREWYRAALVDLSSDCEITLPLVAANAYWVGQVHIQVQAGKAAVSYTLFGRGSQVFRERLQLLSPGTALTEALVLSNRKGLKLSQDAPVFHSLKNTDHALVYLRLDGIFDVKDPLNRKISWQQPPWPHEQGEEAAQAARIRQLFAE